VDEAYKADWLRFKEMYADLARRYPGGWQPIAVGATV